MSRDIILKISIGLFCCYFIYLYSENLNIKIPREIQTILSSAKDNSIKNKESQKSTETPVDTTSYSPVRMDTVASDSVNPTYTQVVQSETSEHIAKSKTHSPDVNFADSQEFLRILNQYRHEHNLEPLIYDAIVEKAAQIQCEYLYRKKINDHLHDNVELPTAQYRLDKTGYVTTSSLYKYRYCENAIHYASMSPSDPDFKQLEYEMFMDYKRSPNHNKNMLNENVTKVGIYTIYDGKDLYNIMVFVN